MLYLHNSHSFLEQVVGRIVNCLNNLHNKEQFALEMKNKIRNKKEIK